MTLTEAMYCMESYYKDNSPCELCPYYRSEKVVIDGSEFYKCKEQEAHELVFKYIAAAERSKNTKVISLSTTGVTSPPGSSTMSKSYNSNTPL